MKMAARSVLIVDDNELNLRLAETVLRHAGFDVHVARTAAEARQRLAERQWAAVLMDLRLPDGNGLDIVREVRADPLRSGTRIAALTASAMVGDPQQAFDAGCNAYISKPIEVRTFAEEVRTLIDRADTTWPMGEPPRQKPGA
jgi:two-component system cell cycle response regulator DivK